MSVGKTDCGKLLASGGHRNVYEYKPEKRYVVKEVKSSFRFGHNLNEWNLWMTRPDLRQWLAPCLDISKAGRYLLQERGRKPRTIPTDYPKEFADTKPANWITLEDGRTVMCDYGADAMARRLIDTTQMLSVD